MDTREAAWAEHERRRWLRPDWDRWLRPDWERYVQPAHRDAMRQEIAERKAAFETPRERAARLREEQAARDAERDWETECAERKFRSDLAWERFKLAVLQLRRKAGYNPNQRRVPAGHGRESGRWGEPRGIGHNQGPPLGEPPAIPRQAPAAAKERTAIAKQVAKWLVRGAAVVAGRTPVGLAAVTAATGAVWLYNQYSAHIEAYRDPPKTFEELQQAASSPRAGYDEHHVAERTSAAQDGFPKSQIESPENRLLIPRMKHWEITGWYMRPSKDYGGLSPREYLRGKSWDERVEVGRRALIEHGVLKQ